MDEKVHFGVKKYLLSLKIFLKALEMKKINF